MVVISPTLLSGQRPRRFVAFAALLFFFTSCAGDELVTEPGPGEDQGAGASDMGAPPASPDASPDAASWTVRFSPVEWGLFEGPGQLGAPLVLPLTPDAQGALQGAQLLPPGVWQIDVRGADAGASRAFFSSSRVIEPMAYQGTLVEEAALPEPQRARQFNATDALFQVTLDPETRHLALWRQEMSLLSPDWSSVTRQGGEAVGERFDAALERDVDVGQVLDLMEDLAEFDAGPVPTSRGDLFVAPGEEGGAPPEVRGTFTAWEHEDRATLRKIDGALWGRYLTLPPSRSSYKLVYDDNSGSGGTWFTHVADRHIEWDGIDTGGVGAFNSVILATPYVPDTARGRLVWWRSVASSLLGDVREVYIYLPARYDLEPTQRFPVLYVQDGNESLTRSQFHEVADAEFAAHPERAAILVFVGLPSQEARMAQYTVSTPEARGERYARFLAEELVEKVDAAFRTRAEARARGVMGASLGGLISYWTATHHPDQFEYMAGMSSSFFWDASVMIKEIERLGCQQLTYYLDSGSPDDNADVTREMAALLQRLGCDFEHVEQSGGRHEWSYWRGRFPNVLRTFAQVHQAR